MIARLELLLLAALTASALADPHEERLWTGINGKTFTGAYITTDERTGRFVFALAGGKSYVIDPGNISEKDLKWLDLELHPEKKPKPKATDPDAFLPDPDFDRTVFPIINQSDYGSKASDCVPSAFCNFVLWWDMQGYLPIDKRGGFDKKAEYIHSRMARYFKTRNTAGTDLDDAEEGTKAYFEKELAELATVRVVSDYDCSPDNLRRYTTGPNATLLSVSVFYGRKDEGGHVVALADVDDTGDLIMYTWGTRIRGRLKPTGKVRLRYPSSSEDGHIYTVEFMNKGDLPEWMIDNEVRFEINPMRSDRLMVISPYRYKTPGAGLPPPPDPLMEVKLTKRRPPAGSASWKPDRQQLTAPVLPHPFKTPVAYHHEWTRNDGTKVAGTIVATIDNAITITRDGESEDIPVSALVPEDQARCHLWQGTTNSPPELPAGRYEYSLRRISGGPAFECQLVITVAADRFRIALPNMTPKRIIVGDTGNGHFWVRWNNQKQMIGRLPLDRMLPQAPEAEDVSIWEQLRDGIPEAPSGKDAGWPGRMLVMQSPPPATSRSWDAFRFRDPALLFSSYESLPLLSALRMILEPESSVLEGTRKAYLIFGGMDLANGHNSARDFLGFCHQARLVPLKLQWTNTVDPKAGPQSTKHMQHLAGTFQLELTKVNFGPQDAKWLQIPEAAASVPVGSHRVVPAGK